MTNLLRRASTVHIFVNTNQAETMHICIKSTFQKAYVQWYVRILSTVNISEVWRNYFNSPMFGGEV